MVQQKKTESMKVKDQLSQWHLLTKELGRGGQGVVYRTADPELLVKMPLKDGKEITDIAGVEEFQKKFERLYLLPLTESMHITRPLYLLEDKAGYVMQMMQDMQPIGELLPQLLNKQSSKEFIYPDWLSKDVPIGVAYPLDMYARSGGSKRRLELLTQATIELLRLHSVGVIFMDISPDNIFVSSDPNYNEVWLIDADNLRFETVNAKHGVITPQYGAPEIVKGIDGGRVVSDAYSWALLAFKILAMVNAFDGQLFLDAQDDEDWAKDESVDIAPSLDVQAERGELPFIFDATDDSNKHIGRGLPANLIFTPDLLNFFQKMFGEGRVDQWKRPSLHSLPRLFAQAADSSIQCCCGMSFYYNSSESTPTCPYCQQQPQKLLVVTSYFYSSEEIGEVAWHWVAPFLDMNLQLPKRLSGHFDIDQHNVPMLEINQIEQDKFLYVPIENVQVSITDENGKFVPLIGHWLLEKQQLEEGVQLYLHFPYSVIIEIKVQKNYEI